MAERWIELLPDGSSPKPGGRTDQNTGGYAYELNSAPLPVNQPVQMWSDVDGSRYRFEKDEAPHG